MAATKIQAGFRGSKARKEVNEMKKRKIEMVIGKVRLKIKKFLS